MLLRKLPGSRGSLKVSRHIKNPHVRKNLAIFVPHLQGPEPKTLTLPTPIVVLAAVAWLQLVE